MSDLNAVCCPPFDPQPWDEQEVTWEDKPFVADRVRCFLHIPINFGSVMKRTMAAIESADAKSEQPMVLTDDNSLWGADVFIAVTKDVPGAKMKHLSGTFVSKVFDGPYSHVPKWMKETTTFVESQGRNVQQMYSFYTTCPKCAKKYGHNYVVMMAQV